MIDSVQPEFQFPRKTVNIKISGPRVGRHGKKSIQTNNSAPQMKNPRKNNFSHPPFGGHHLIKRLSIRKRTKKHASEMDRHHHVNAGLKNEKIMWKNSFFLRITENQFTTYQLTRKEWKSGCLHPCLVTSERYAENSSIQNIFRHYLFITTPAGLRKPIKWNTAVWSCLATPRPRGVSV